MLKKELPLLKKVKNVLIGQAISFREPKLFHNFSLIAFFAWVGFGIDGLSSSCYGPEEAFLVLQHYPVLSVFIGIATAITIFVISASYAQIIELFPSGGGGYLVASKLLSPTVGMISGCALLIDYVLTITISVSSGIDALLSFMPAWMYTAKLPFAVCSIILLSLINLRGAKESVYPLIPIFITFIVTHVFIIFYVIIVNLTNFHTLTTSIVTDLKLAQADLGLSGVIFLILTAYGMGAGTYTGIEAVSNSMPILREPKVQTAKKTMKYSAISLAFIATGLFISYFLYNVHHVPGKTLNYTLVSSVASNLGYWGTIFVIITILSETLLLFFAGQTGFLDGPRVLANMALDRWFPSQFALLSDRLVIKNGIIIMGLSSLILLLLTKGSVKFLIILYSINVFITFTLSQLGMIKHWWGNRNKHVLWKRKLLINMIGFSLTAFILVSIILTKFHHGGWVTLVLTGSLVTIGLLIKRYYKKTQKYLHRVDKLIHIVEMAEKNYHKDKLLPKLDKNSKTAVILVNGFNGIGLHVLFNIIKLFGENFKNFFFIEAGVLDVGNFKGTQEIHNLEQKVQADLTRYKNFIEYKGYYTKTFMTIGPEVIDEICHLARDIFKKYPNSVFFGSQVVFEEETILTKLLYNHMPLAVQRRLHQEGLPFIIMPIKVW